MMVLYVCKYCCRSGPRGTYRGGRGAGQVRGGFRGRGQVSHPYGRRSGDNRRDSFPEGSRERLARDIQTDYQYKGEFPMPPPPPLDRYKNRPDLYDRRVSPPIGREYYTDRQDPFERPPPAYYKGSRTSATNR